MNTQTIKSENYQLILNSEYQIWDGSEWFNNSVLIEIIEDTEVELFTYRFKNENKLFSIDSDFLYKFTEKLFKKRKNYLFIGDYKELS